MDGPHPRAPQNAMPQGTIAFTLNPNPAAYRSPIPSDQYRALLHALFANKQIRHTFETFTFFPELTVAGNVHIHGYYVIRDPIKYYNWFLPAAKRLGYCCIKGRDITEKWAEYCTKSFSAIRDLMDDDLPIPIDNASQPLYKKILKAKYTLALKGYGKPRVRTIPEFI